VTDSGPADRIRTLLLRGDNLLKHGRSQDKARQAFEEAQRVAEDPAVDERVRELIERRLAALDDR
jgi:predicted negative regulator of RcsB-dependent stress response